MAERGYASAHGIAQLTMTQEGSPTRYMLRTSPAHVAYHLSGHVVTRREEVGALVKCHCYHGKHTVN